uniref:Uncharacterized protein n=1 Tax=OCS116 cluster bacterium TaxID=2030921 RepID=A0A2A4Z5T7_9PROT
MNGPLKTKPKSPIIMAIIALIFGIATIYSGGEVLFVDGAGRIRAGDYIGFIVWFNFIAGFAYVLAAYGLYKSKQWSVLFSKIIAIATLIAFGALGVHIFNDGAFEIRTIAAMMLRSLVWVVIAYFASKKIKN